MNILMLVQVSLWAEDKVVGLPSNTNWDVLICCCFRRELEVGDAEDETRLLTGEWATKCVAGGVDVVLAAVKDKGTLFTES